MIKNSKINEIPNLKEIPLINSNLNLVNYNSNSDSDLDSDSDSDMDIIPLIEAS
jgi:hypothetical protein